MTTVQHFHVKSFINGKVRNLKKADMKPQVQLPRDGLPSLLVSRYGNCECLPISRRVAEELIAAGLSYAN